MASRLDAAKYALISHIDPAVIVDDWNNEAAHVYASTGILWSASQCKEVFYSTLALFNGAEAAKKALAAKIRSADKPDVIEAVAVSAHQPRIAHHDELLAGHAIIDALYGADTFRAPVPPGVMMTYNGAELGPYSEIVKSPASLSQMKSAIEDGGLSTAEAAAAYVMRIAANCVMFNAPEGDFPVLARTYAGIATRELQQVLR